MVKLTKRAVSPSPITSENDYRNNPNFAAIHEDCFGKCYICEYDKATTLNVEHRVPHRGNASIKYAWDNLFLSCGHCNNIKGDGYDNILNPTACDPEDYILLSLNYEDFVEVVLAEARTNDESAIQTARLLTRVYNGGVTDMKDIESANLRNALSKCVKKFNQYIKDYQDEPDEGYDLDIEKEISRSSAFAAFKRKIVREDAALATKFAEALA